MTRPPLLVIFSSPLQHFSVFAPLVIHLVSDVVSFPLGSLSEQKRLTHQIRDAENFGLLNHQGQLYKFLYLFRCEPPRFGLIDSFASSNTRPPARVPANLGRHLGPPVPALALLGAVPGRVLVDSQVLGGLDGEDLLRVEGELRLLFLLFLTYGLHF